MPPCARLQGTQSYRLSRNLVPSSGNAPLINGYQPIVIPFNYPGKLAEGRRVELHPC